MGITLPSGELRINGKKIKAEKTIPVVSPATEEIIGEICAASEREVTMAVEAAQGAFRTWKVIPLKHRLSYIRKFRNLAIQKLEELAQIDATESGKPIYYGLVDAALGCALTPKYYEMFAEEFLKDEKIHHPFPFNLISQMKISYRVFSPMGVIGIISPWNSPIALTMIHLLPSLVAGNTVVLKPSSYSSFVMLKVYEIFEEAGLPPGVLNVVTGRGEEVGAYLTRAKVRKIAFTGSSKTAVTILENCAKRLTPATLELGGDDAMIVLKDADLDSAASAAVFGSFFNSGQICFASKRIIVAKEIKKDFLKKVLNRVKKLKVGNPLEKDTEIGPLIFKNELDKMDRFVQDAVLKGAKVECGGKRIEGKGYFYEPTVLSGVNMSMSLAYEERFGPIMSIFEFESEEEAIAMANFPEYGLSSSIWSRNIKKAREIAHRMEAGVTSVNDIFSFALYAPYGGIKRSGFGKTLAKEGLLDATFQRTIEVLERKPLFVSLVWFPWTKVSFESVLNLIKVFFSDGVKGKAGALIRGLKALFARQKEYKEFIKEEKQGK